MPIGATLCNVTQRNREKRPLTELQQAILEVIWKGGPATAEQVRDLMGKGFAGAIFLTTDDCVASYDELKSRGVEFVEEPEERPYGIDCGFRDPSGNHFRLTQVTMAGV